MARNFIGNKLSNELKYLRGKEFKKVFAKKIGVSYRTYLRYESGETKPKEPVMRVARKESKHITTKGDRGFNEEYPSHLPLIHDVKEASCKNENYINDLLEATHKILTSGNQFAIDALERNIRYFSYTIDLENRLKNLEQRFEILEGKKAAAKNL